MSEPLTDEELAKIIRTLSTRRFRISDSLGRILATLDADRKRLAEQDAEILHGMREICLERARAEKAEVRLALAGEVVTAAQRLASNVCIVKETRMDAVLGPTYVVYGIALTPLEVALAAYQTGDKDASNV